MLTTHEPTGCNTPFTLQASDAKGQNKNTPIIYETTLQCHGYNGSVLIVSRLVQCTHGVHDTSTISATSAATLEITNRTAQIIQMCCVSPVHQPRVSVFTNLPCSSLSRSFPLSPRSHLWNSFIQLAHM